MMVNYTQPVYIQCHFLGRTICLETNLGRVNVMLISQGVGLL